MTISDIFKQQLALEEQRQERVALKHGFAVIDKGDDPRLGCDTYYVSKTEKAPNGSDDRVFVVAHVSTRMWAVRIAYALAVLFPTAKPRLRTPPKWRW